ncbi:MAG: glycoside hydrolase family 25 protein [Oscillospiraceae bacterium]|nr:glycoside hydrolase family 25 protein [Oscillospiraceae bacterium]
MAIYESGVDVSRYQGEIDWPKVAAAGRQFALVRLGSSGGNGPYVDPYFLQNVEGAHAAGLKVGAYYYSYATTREQADNELETYLAALEGQQLEYPVFVDVESSSLTALGRAELTDLVKYAMDVLYRRGWYAGYYTYTNFANTYLDTARLAEYPFWVADYRGYVGYAGSYDLWQYSSSGRVNGISGAVDLDYSYWNFLPQIQAGGYNGYQNAGPALLPLTGRALEVFNQRCEYFTGPDVNAVVGYLPLGRYPALSVSDGSYSGYVWVVFRYRGGEYWTALLEDRCRLVESEEDSACRRELEEARNQLEASRSRQQQAAGLARQALELLEEDDEQQDGQ